MGQRWVQSVGAVLFLFSVALFGEAPTTSDGAEEMGVSATEKGFVFRSSVQDKKPQRALKCAPLIAQIEDHVSQVVEPMAKEGLESALKCFFKGIGRCLPNVNYFC